MRKTAVSLLALCVAAPLFADGHEIAKPFLGPSPLIQSEATVATNGETFATVWGDGKVYGAIADAAGKRTNATDLIIVPHAATGMKLTAFGREYLLFWNDNSVAHLTDAGPDLQPRQTHSIVGLPPLDNVSIASSDNQMLVTGMTTTADNVAYVINRDGSIATGPIELSNLGGLRFPIQTSWSGHDFLIASTTRSGVVLQRIANGSLTTVPITSAGVLWAAAASSGNETVVAWMEWVAGGPDALWSAVVNGDTVVNKQQVAGFVTSNGYVPNMVWTGNAYVVTGGNFGIRLDSRGTALEPPVGLDRIVQAFAAIGDEIYAISQGWDFNSVFPKLIITTARTSGGIHEVRNEYLATTPSADDGPAIAADGLNFIAAFRDATAAAQSVAMVPLPPSLSGDASNAIPLANMRRGSMPAIARGASVNLVVWADQSGVYARRVTSAGMFDTQPIAIAGSSMPIVDAASNGHAFLVVWVDSGGVLGAMVDENGIASQPRLIGPRGTDQPRVAWNGKVFLVIYGTPRGCYAQCPGRAATLAVRVAANGVPIDTSPVAIDTPSTDLLAASMGAVASDGTRFLIALSTQSGIELVPVTADDSTITVGPRQPVFIWLWETRVDIRWAGLDYVLASSYGLDQYTWLATTRISRDGQPSGQEVTPITVPAFSPPDPAVAVNSAGESAVVVAEPIGDPPVPRVRAYFDSDLKPAPARPSAPKGVSATGTPSNFTVTWSVGSDADGVVIQSNFGGSPQIMAVVPATENSRTFSNVYASSVIVRAFNAGGMSELVTTSVRVPPRRRAVR
jgi:hypothetical protein